MLFYLLSSFHHLNLSVVVELIILISNIYGHIVDFTDIPVLLGNDLLELVFSTLRSQAASVLALHMTLRFYHKEQLLVSRYSDC